MQQGDRLRRLRKIGEARKAWEYSSSRSGRGGRGLEAGGGEEFVVKGVVKVL